MNMHSSDEAFHLSAVGRSSPLTVAETVRQNLVKAAEERRKQAAAIVSLVGAQKERIRVLTEELGRAREAAGRVRELAEELAESRDEAFSLAERLSAKEQEHDVLLSNQHRLYDGFVSLLRAVDEMSGAQGNIDEMLEAMIVDSNAALGLGADEGTSPSDVGGMEVVAPAEMVADAAEQSDTADGAEADADAPAGHDHGRILELLEQAIREPAFQAASH